MSPVHAYNSGDGADTRRCSIRAGRHPHHAAAADGSPNRDRGPPCGGPDPPGCSLRGPVLIDRFIWLGLPGQLQIGSRLLSLPALTRSPAPSRLRRGRRDPSARGAAVGREQFPPASCPTNLCTPHPTVGRHCRGAARGAVLSLRRLFEFCRAALGERPVDLGAVPARSRRTELARSDHQRSGTASLPLRPGRHRPPLAPNPRAGATMRTTHRIPWKPLP
jgi:hypothetical protein